MSQPESWMVQDEMLSAGCSKTGLQYVDEKTLMLISGACLKLGSDVALGAPAQFLTCETPHGISCAAANWRMNVLAYAEKSLNPAIYVYEHPSLELLAKLDGGAEIEVSALSFARNKTWLASLGAEPDLAFVVWDYSTGAQVARSKAQAACVSLTLDPQSPLNAATMTVGGVLSMWQLRPVHGSHNVSTVDIMPALDDEEEDAERGMLAGGADESGGGARFTSLCWASGSLLYAAGSTGTLQCFEAPGGVERTERRAQLPAAPTALVALRGHIVAACGHEVVWVELESAAVCFAVHIGVGIRALALSPPCVSLIAECDDATTRKLVLARPELIPSTPEDALDAAAVLEAGDRLEGSDEAVSIVEIGAGHAGAISGMGVLPAPDPEAADGPPPCLITCGDDGCVRAWDFAALEQLQVIRPPGDTKPSALAVCRLTALVAVGSSGGAVRLLRRMPSGVLVLVLVKRFADSPVVAVAFDAEGARLAVVHANGTVAFVCTFGALRTLGVGVAAVGSRPLAAAWAELPGAGPRLLVSGADRTVVRLTPPPLSEDAPDDLRLTKSLLRPRSTLLPSRARALSAAPVSFGPESVFAACEDGTVRAYAVAPDEYRGGALDGDEAGGRDAPGASESGGHEGEVLTTHEMGASALAVGNDGRHYASGSASGVVLVQGATVDTQGEWAMRAFDSVLGGCAAVALFAEEGSEKTSLLFGGQDGVLYSCELLNRVDIEPPPPPPPNELAAPALGEEANVADAEVPLELETVVSSISEEEAARRSDARADGLAKLDRIRAQLHALLQRNEGADELERLPPDELVIDEQLRAELARAADAEADAFRRDARRRNLRKLLLWERTQQEVVAPMATKGVAIEPLPVPDVEADGAALGATGASAGGGAAGLSTRKPGGAAEAAPLPAPVHNYPLRKPSANTERARRAVRLLREVELRERAWLATEGLADEDLAAAAFEDAPSIEKAIGRVPGDDDPEPGEAAAGGAAAGGAQAAAASADADDDADIGAGADGADGADGDADGDAIAAEGGGAAGAAGAAGGGGAAAAAAAALPAAAAAGAAAASAGTDRSVAILAAAAGRELSTRELCYPPYELYTERRKRAQVILRAQLVENTKARFNKQFDALATAKRKEVERIHEKDARIDEICAELGVGSAAHRPAFSQAEEPERQLHVDDAEIVAPKWESAEERAKREAQEKAAAERAAAANRDDAPRRALRQMMHGTLERKRDDELAEELLRPAWMAEKAAEEMTEEELNAVREFEARAKKIEEEREKVRKGLQAEMAKLRADESELCRAFNAKLGALAAHKLDVDQAVFELELMMIKISQSQLRAEQQVRRQRAMADELDVLRARRLETAAARDAFAARVDDARAAYERAENENRARGNEKTFRTREFADAPEHVDALWRLFRRREVVKVRVDVPGDEDEQPAGHHADHSNVFVAAANAAGAELSRTDLETVPGVSELDPFLEADRAAVPTKDEVQKLDAAVDLPEGMGFNLWDRLERMRTDKIAKEEEVAQKKAELEEMERHLAELDAEDGDVAAAIEQLEHDSVAFVELRQKEAWDVEVPIKLRQGQIEVEQAAVVTDFANALFVHRDAVRSLNTEITRLGGEKVEILKEVRDFRKGIAELLWENERLAMEGNDLIERTREFQLLRVTKDLQKLMRGGGEDSQIAEVSQLERKLDSMGSSHDARVAERERQLKKMHRLRAEKHAELMRLRGQIEALEATVSERETIAQIQSVNTDSSMEASRRVHHVNAQRKLKSLIKMQAQEIELLREELDRLRRRTFPTFTNYEQARRQPVD